MAKKVKTKSLKIAFRKEVEQQHKMTPEVLFHVNSGYCHKFTTYSNVSSMCLWSVCNLLAARFHKKLLHM
jgi:hypothetical protein